MRLLLFLISWFLFSVSYTVGQTVLTSENKPDQAIEIPLFDTDSDQAVFRGSIDVYKHYFSGIFALKKVSNHEYRMVMMSEVGMTFFDLSYNLEGYTLNYCIEPLQKKGLINLLYKDFLLMSHTPEKTALKAKNRRKQNHSVFKKKDSRDFYFLQEGMVVKIISKGFFNRINLSFDKIDKVLANKIQIQHRPVKIKMVLDRMK